MCTTKLDIDVKVMKTKLFWQACHITCGASSFLCKHDRATKISVFCIHTLPTVLIETLQCTIRAIDMTTEQNESSMRPTRSMCLYISSIIDSKGNWNHTNIRQIPCVDSATRWKQKGAYLSFPPLWKNNKIYFCRIEISYHCCYALSSRSKVNPIFGIVC